jgi:membrane fusion protein (multidrug efflux system)
MMGQKGPQKGCFTGYRRKMRVGFILLLAAAVCIAAAGSGCSKKQDQVKAEKVVNVKVATTEKQSVRPYIEAVGSLKPNDEVTISSEVDGILKAIKVNEGSQVTGGMPLAVVNDLDYRLAVDNAEAALKQAEAGLSNTKMEYERKTALFKEELVTKQQYDDVSTRLTIASRDIDRARSSLSLAREKLRKTAVCSPMVGMVKEKMVAAGDFARAGTPLMRIVQIDPLKLSFTVAEKDIGALKAGQDVIFTSDPFPGKEFTGRLTTIYPSLDERSRTLQVEAVVKNPSLQLKPGLFARVKLYTGAPKEAVLVPVTSILYEGSKVKVFLMEGDKAREQSLKIGGKYGEMMEVVEGLNGGEQLIVVGQNNLVDGVKVHAIK